MGRGWGGGRGGKGEGRGEGRGERGGERGEGREGRVGERGEGGEGVKQKHFNYQFYRASQTDRHIHSLTHTHTHKHSPAVSHRASSTHFPSTSMSAT